MNKEKIFDKLLFMVNEYLCDPDNCDDCIFNIDDFEECQRPTCVEELEKLIAYEPKNKDVLEKLGFEKKQSDDDFIGYKKDANLITFCNLNGYYRVTIHGLIDSNAITAISEILEDLNDEKETN